MRVCYKWDNVWFGGGVGDDGVPWKESLDQVDALGLEPEARRTIIRGNAIELFRL